MAILWYQQSTHGGNRITSLKNRLPKVETAATIQQKKTILALFPILDFHAFKTDLVFLLKATWRSLFCVRNGYLPIAPFIIKVFVIRIDFQG